MINYIKVFGGVYLLLAVWGIPALAGRNFDGVLFNLVHVNLATELLHIAVAASVIAVGRRNMPNTTNRSIKTRNS